MRKGRQKTTEKIKWTLCYQDLISVEAILIGNPANIIIFIFFRGIIYIKGGQIILKNKRMLGPFHLVFIQQSHRRDV